MIMKEIKAIFLHVPKTGGTSIKSIFERVTPCWIPDWHMTEDEFIKLVPDYNDYFKFSFVRNPWDRMVSMFYFRKYNIEKISKEKTFKQWVLENEYTHERDILSQFSFLKGSINFIGKYENLEKDLHILFEILKLNLPNIPKLNQSNHLNFHYYYDKKSYNIVKKWSQEDCEKFNYNFPYLYL